MKKSEFDAVKRLSIVQFLGAMNVVPARKTGAEHGYRSPIREGDYGPSFFVNEHKNAWFDHGVGVGGNIIDLAMCLFQTDYKTAGQMLAQIQDNPQALRAAEAAVVAHEARIAKTLEPEQEKRTIVRQGPLEYGPLRNYLVSRKINLNVIANDGRLAGRLREVFYTRPGQKREKPYFAIGFVNDSGGMELRSRGYQSCHGTKDVTYLKGQVPGVAIFEGFMDYLAALTLRRKPFTCSVLILNSVTNARKSLHLVENEPIIYAFLDNDETGLNTLAYYRFELPNTTFDCQNEVYRGFKDVNDYLMQQKPNKPLPARGAMPSKRSHTARWWLWVVFEQTPYGKKGIRMELNSKGIWQRCQGPDSECTFYSYNNHQDGYEALLALRHRIQDEVKVSRLCERTTGRKFTYEQLFHFLPQDKAQVMLRRKNHHKGLTSTYERTLHDHGTTSVPA